MSLDNIPKKKEKSITLKMSRKGKILAFADDILISIYLNKVKEIELFIKQLKIFGLSTNPMKINYLAPQQILS